MSRGVIDQVLKTAIKPTTVKQISLPYTPPANGLVIIVLRASATGRFYESYNNATPNLCDAYTVGNNYAQGIVFVEKGKQMSVAAASNLSSHQYFFIPLNISGADEP